MFGRTVKVDGWEIIVMCSPDTPRWEVLRRAANQAEREHRTAEIRAEYQRKSAAINRADT